MPDKFWGQLYINILHTTMKKVYFTLMAIFAITMGFTSCKEEEPTQIPVIEFAQDSVILSDQGSTEIIGYRVNNPIKGEKLTATHQAQWLTVNTDSEQNIEFSATLNEEYEERSTEVTFSYKNAQDVVLKVTQSGKPAPISIEVVDITATEIFFNVKTTDPSLTWIPMITNAAYFDTIESDEQLFQEDLEYFEYFAGLNDLSLSDFLKEMLEEGSVENMSIEDLTPENEYVLYAYGLTLEGERTTDIAICRFSTEAPYEGEITFEFILTEEDYTLNFDIIPSHTGVPYYYGIIDEPTLNEWYEKYNTTDLKEAIQNGDIEETIQMYMDYEFIDYRSEYYAIYNNISKVEDGYLKCKANTNYIIYAAKWDEDCNLVGEVSFQEHRTADISGSEIELDIELSDITQSSVMVKATPSNNDPYAMIAEKSEYIAGMNDTEIFAYIMEHYDAFIGEYTFNGAKERKYSRLTPDTDYTLLAFGYKAGTLTSSTITKEEFKTLASGDPKDCTFEITAIPSSDEVAVEIIPSDKGHHYHWMVYTSEYTSDQAKAYIRDVLIDQYYEGNFPAFASWELAQGDLKSEAWDLFPNTEYKIGVVIMDYNTGEFLSDVTFSETFTTGEANYADITISVEFGPYYDIEELVAAGQTQFESLIGESDAILPTSIVIEGEYSEFYYDIYRRDLTDTETYPDEVFYQDLYYGSTYESTTFPLPYDTEMTIVAVALDKQYNYSRLFRKAITLTKEGASPVDEYIATLSLEGCKFPIGQRSIPLNRAKIEHDADYNFSQIRENIVNNSKSEKNFYEAQESFFVKKENFEKGLSTRFFTK